MTPTNKQVQRQKHRKDDGKYTKVNPCYHCGKSAGVDYCSHPCTDGGRGSEMNDEGLCLCQTCCCFLESLPNDEALRRFKISNYGSNPQVCK
jgi:hypothetical protein